jgi:tetratricopeptide (TPR) repeat protein
MRTLLFSALACVPVIGFAAGEDTFTPPTPTETTTTCSGATVWDPKTQSCVDTRDSSLTDQDRYDAVRELAYAGAYTRAQAVLASFSAPRTSGALTYAGFIARKTGDMNAAYAFYAQALEIDPDNVLTRSYLGQAHVEQGDLVAARAELREIRARGGRETWAEFSLQSAISSGKGYAY